MIDLSHIILFPFPKLQRACTGKQRTQYRQPDTRRSPPSPSNTLDRFNKPFTAKNNWQLFDRPLKTRRRSERENVVEVLLYHDNSEGTMSFGVKRQGLDYTVTKTFEASNKPEHTSAEKNQIRLKFSTYFSPCVHLPLEIIDIFHIPLLWFFRWNWQILRVSFGWHSNTGKCL